MMCIFHFYPSRYANDMLFLGWWISETFANVTEQSWILKEWIRYFSISNSFTKFLDLYNLSRWYLSFASYASKCKIAHLYKQPWNNFCGHLREWVSLWLLYYFIQLIIQNDLSSFFISNSNYKFWCIGWYGIIRAIDKFLCL